LKIISRVLPALVIVLSGMNYCNALYFKLEMTHIFDHPTFQYYKGWSIMTIILSITMFVCGILIVLLSGCKNKIIKLLCIGIQGSVCLLGLAAALYSAIVVGETPKRIQKYWTEPSGDITSFIESSFRCCGFDTISPGGCACQSAECYALNCQDGFLHTVQKMTTVSFVCVITSDVAIALSFVYVCYSFFKKEKTTYISFK